MIGRRKSNTEDNPVATEAGLDESGPRLHVGQVIGPGPWVTIDQTMIDGFALHTRDPDPFHIDPEWARANSPFGSTIAFGFLTIALLTHLMHGAQGNSARDVAADPAVHGHYLNYGFDRLRLVSPVSVGSRVRGIFTVADFARDAKSRGIMSFDCRVEIEGSDKPALVARWLTVWMPGAA